MSSFACEIIHQGHKLLNLEEEKRSINLCLVALLCDQLLPIQEWRCQDIDQVLLHGRCFLTSASSSTEIPGQNSILRKLPTTACWFRVKMGKDIEQLLAISKSKCPSLVEANHSTVKLNDSLHFHTNSSPVEANNSKSVPFGPAKPTVESCSLSVEAKKLKKYQSLVEANYSVVKSDDCFTLKSKDSSSSPVEASYSKSVLFGRLIRPLSHVLRSLRKKNLIKLDLSLNRTTLL